MKFDDFHGFIKVTSDMRADPSVFNQAVIELDSTNFERIIHNKKKNVFVLFYAKWCNSCKDFINTLEKVGNSMVMQSINKTENNTWMCGNKKFISSVNMDISRGSESVYYIKKLPQNSIKTQC